MTDRIRWALLMTGCALFLGVALQIPQWMYILHPQFRGILVHLNSDEYQYLARLEEALTGRPEQSAQPYVGDPYAQGMHYAFIEQAEGMLFGWTGWRAATVFQVMDGVIPPLLFFAVIFFFRLSGFSRRSALGGALLFVLPLFYSLNRPIHQRESFLLVLSTILCVMLAMEKKSRFFTVLAGAALGALFGVYLWAWMFAWTYVGLLLFVELFAWLRQRERLPFLNTRLWTVVCVVGVGVIAALPFLAGIMRGMQHPLYAEMAFRQGMHFTRLPESWIYSLLFLFMSVVLLLMRRKVKELQGPKMYAILFPVAVFVVINQQVIHGHVIAFTSHFTFAIALASVCAFLLSLPSIEGIFGNRTHDGNRTHEEHRTQGRVLLVLLSSLGVASLMLAAIAWDNRPGWRLFDEDAGRLDEQHFGSLLPILDAMPRTRILSDSGSSGFISSSTQHDIVSSIYLESAFMTSEEIAERWCLTVLPLPPAERRISEQIHLVWPDANAANRGTDVREREVKMVEAACKKLDADPPAALRRYGVSYILWDRKRQPLWELKRLKVPLTQVAEDSGGWVLYSIIPR